MNNTSWILPPGLLEEVFRFERFFDAAFKSGTGKRQPLMIRGPRGVGKTLFTEIFARLYSEMRKGVEVLWLNVSTIPENLVDSFLFGHTKGAFTGAAKDAKGFFEKDSNSKDPLFILEEIGEWPEYLQIKMLTFLETGRYHKIGDPSEKRTGDFQIVATTNQPREKFRADFFDRFIKFSVAPVHERREDVLYYLEAAAPEIIPLLLPYQVLTLLAYEWPGNVREIERAALAIKTAHSEWGGADETGLMWFRFSPDDTGLIGWAAPML